MDETFKDLESIIHDIDTDHESDEDYSEHKSIDLNFQDYITERRAISPFVLKPLSESEPDTNDSVWSILPNLKSSTAKVYPILFFRDLPIFPHDFHGTFLLQVKSKSETLRKLTLFQMYCTYEKCESIHDFSRHSSFSYCNESLDNVHTQPFIEDNEVVKEEVKGDSIFCIDNDPIDCSPFYDNTTQNLDLLSACTRVKNVARPVTWEIEQCKVYLYCWMLRIESNSVNSIEDPDIEFFVFFMGRISKDLLKLMDKNKWTELPIQVSTRDKCLHNDRIIYDKVIVPENLRTIKTALPVPSPIALPIHESFLISKFSVALLRDKLLKSLPTMRDRVLALSTLPAFQTSFPCLIHTQTNFSNALNHNQEIIIQRIKHKKWKSRIEDVDIPFGVYTIHTFHCSNQSLEFNVIPFDTSTFRGIFTVSLCVVDISNANKIINKPDYVLHSGYFDVTKKVVKKFIELEPIDKTQFITYRINLEPCEGLIRSKADAFQPFELELNQNKFSIHECVLEIKWFKKTSNFDTISGWKLQSNFINVIIAHVKRSSRQIRLRQKSLLKRKVTSQDTSEPS